jgi:hypothetical protein
MRRRSTKVSLSARDIKIISAAIWRYAQDIESANLPLTARKVLEAGDRFLNEVYVKEGKNETVHQGR